MKIQPYIDKLNAAPEYAKFMKENPDAFMAAGFFVIDFENGANVHQLDYYVPSKKKIAAFTLDNKVMVQMLDAMNEEEPQKLDAQVGIDLDALQGIVDDEMKNRGMSEKINKMIAILQNVDGKKIWHINCVLSGMQILKAKVDDSDKTILEMERKSIMDFVKKVSPEELAKMQKEQGNNIQPLSPKEIEGQIEKLDKLEKAIDGEKEKLEKLGEGKGKDVVKK